MVVRAGALRALSDVMTESRAPVQVRCDAAWALSNVAAGTPAQVQHLIDTAGSVAALCDVLETASTKSLRSECAWALANLARRGGEAAARLEPGRLARLLRQALEARLDPALEPALLDALAVSSECGDEELLAEADRQPPGSGVGPSDDRAVEQENLPPEVRVPDKDQLAAVHASVMNQSRPLQLAKLNVVASGHRHVPACKTS